MAPAEHERGKVSAATAADTFMDARRFVAFTGKRQPFTLLSAQLLPARRKSLIPAAAARGTACGSAQEQPPQPLAHRHAEVSRPRAPT